MKIKSVVAFVLVLCMCMVYIPVQADAAEITSGTLIGRMGTLTWDYANGILTITGDDYCIDDKTVPWEHLKDRIKSLVFDGSLSQVGEHFNDLPNLTEIAWPKDMHWVYSAFNNCYSLERVDIPDTVHLIQFSFGNCINLTEVELPNSLTDMSGAFNGCLQLTGITLPNTLENIASSFIESGLTGIVFPSSVKQLVANPSPFANCRNLEKIVFMGSPPELLYDKPFHGTTATVYYYAGNAKWTDAVKESYNTDGLLTWSGVWNPGSITFEQPQAGKSWTFQDNTLTVTSLRSFREVAAEWDSAKTAVYEVILEEGITTVPAFTFYDYTNLLRATIPNTVTCIEDSAFCFCESLRSITIPASVTLMQASVFCGCYALENICFIGDAPTIIDPGEYLFHSVTANVYYPRGNDTWTEDVMQQYGGTVTWVPYTPLELKSQSQPNVVIKEGKKATVTVDATGEDLTYAWYYKNPGSKKFSQTDAFTGNTYSVTMSASRSGRQVYCVITDRFGNSITTDTVTLHMGSGATIVKQPANAVAKSGKKATVTLEATGDGLTYTWYFKNPGSSKFSKTSTFTGNTYSVTMDASRNGRQVYCVITDKYGNSVTTDIATLYMGNGATITRQPANAVANIGEKATVSLKAAGDGLTYTWYFKNPDSKKFSKTTSFTGNTYYVAMSASRSGRQLYCVVTDKYGTSVTSDTVTLYAGTPAAVVTQPTDAVVKSGQKATVTVDATGDGLTYTWYFKNPGSSKFSKTSTFTGNTYSVTMSASRSGRQVYCVITDQYGTSVTSDTVTLSIG